MKSFNTTMSIVVLTSLFSNVLFAQQSVKTNAEATKSGASTYDQLLDFSRPGEHHQVMGLLSGTWAYQDAKRTFVKGTLIRKAMYNDRFYNLEITGGKLKVPVAKGQMVRPLSTMAVVDLKYQKEFNDKMEAFIQELRQQVHRRTYSPTFKVIKVNSISSLLLSSGSV